MFTITNMTINKWCFTRTAYCTWTFKFDTRILWTVKRFNWKERYRNRINYYPVYIVKYSRSEIHNLRKLLSIHWNIEDYKENLTHPFFPCRNLLLTNFASIFGSSCANGILKHGLRYSQVRLQIAPVANAWRLTAVAVKSKSWSKLLFYKLQLFRSDILCFKKLILLKLPINCPHCISIVE